MLGTRQAADLFGRIAAGGGRLVLLGDGRQAPPVEAGGVWPTLCEDATSGGRGRYVRLTDACRQQDPAEREAVALLRAGRTTDALHHWNHHDRIVGGDSDDQVIAALANDAATEIVAGEDVLVLAATRDEAERAGFAIRTRLLEHGHLDGGHAQYGTLPLAEGDRVVLRANERALGARNGTRGTVQELTPDGITVVTVGGRSLQLPVTYVAEHVEWTYALTVHTGQGQAADHVHVLTSASLYKELAVVAGSRHRHSVTWHLCAGASEHLRGPQPRPTAADLAQWATQPRAERFAHLEPEPPQPSLADLYTARDQALAVLVEHTKNNGPSTTRPETEPSSKTGSTGSRPTAPSSSRSAAGPPPAPSSSPSDPSAAPPARPCNTRNMTSPWPSTTWPRIPPTSTRSPTTSMSPGLA